VNANFEVRVGQECFGNIGLGIVPKPDGLKAVLVEVKNGVTYFNTVKELDAAIDLLTKARAEAFPNA